MLHVIERIKTLKHCCPNLQSCIKIVLCNVMLVTVAKKLVQSYQVKKALKVSLAPVTLPVLSFQEMHTHRSLFSKLPFENVLM